MSTKCQYSPTFSTAACRRAVKCPSQVRSWTNGPSYATGGLNGVGVMDVNLPHLVPLNGNLPSRNDGENLHGLGACDMKGGDAVILRLAAAVPEPVRDVTYVLYEGEEIESEFNGLGHLATDAPELLEADFAILMEPSDGVVGQPPVDHLTDLLAGCGRGGAAVRVAARQRVEVPRTHVLPHPARAVRARHERTDRGGQSPATAD